jgi:hypothetical protein
MNLAHELFAYLQERGVPAVLIGGVALAAHGVVRATLDTDFLVTDRKVLRASFWDEWTGPDQPDVHRGDDDDPLAGVVRVGRGPETVDIVVCKQSWHKPMFERGILVELDGNTLPSVDAADLVLLKLFAAGPQDLLDIELLLTAEGDQLAREVEHRLRDLPEPMRIAWKRVRANFT